MKLIEEFIYEKTGKIFPDIPITIRKMDQNQFEKQFFKGRSDELIEFYSELLVNNPKEKEIWEKLCFVLNVKGKFWELKKVAIEALELFENDTTFFGFLAKAYEQTGENENASMIKANNKISKFSFSILEKDLKKDLRKVKKWKKS